MLLLCSYCAWKVNILWHCFVLFQIPLFGIPLRIVVMFTSLGPSLYFVFKTSNLILKGGVGKNKSTVAVSVHKLLLISLQYIFVSDLFSCEFC